MIYSLKGTVSDIFTNAIILDIHDIFYKIYIAHPFDFAIGQEYKILIYEIYKEDERYFIGFINEEERDLFKDLLKVKGLGAKSIIKAFNNTTPKEIITAINEENIAFLKKIPGFGTKMSQVIVITLKDKLSSKIRSDDSYYQESKKALVSMGFKPKQVEKTLSSINTLGLHTEEIIKLALKELR